MLFKNVTKAHNELASPDDLNETVRLINHHEPIKGLVIQVLQDDSEERRQTGVLIRVKTPQLKKPINVIVARKDYSVNQPQIVEEMVGQVVVLQLTSLNKEDNLIWGAIKTAEKDFWEDMAQLLEGNQDEKDMVRDCKVVSIVDNYKEGDTEWISFVRLNYDGYFFSLPSRVFFPNVGVQQREGITSINDRLFIGQTVQIQFDSVKFDANKLDMFQVFGHLEANSANIPLEYLTKAMDEMAVVKATVSAEVKYGVLVEVAPGILFRAVGPVAERLDAKSIQEHIELRGVISEIKDPEEKGPLKGIFIAQSIGGVDKVDMDYAEFETKVMSESIK